MKFFAAIILSAIIACTFADDDTNVTTDVTMKTMTKAAMVMAASEAFVGEFKETMDGTMVTVGYYDDNAVWPAECVQKAATVPSCKMGTKWGNSMCYTKCLTMGKMGGICMGKVCTCMM